MATMCSGVASASVYRNDSDGGRACRGYHDLDGGQACHGHHDSDGGRACHGYHAGDSAGGRARYGYHDSDGPGQAARHHDGGKLVMATICPGVASASGSWGHSADYRNWVEPALGCGHVPSPETTRTAPGHAMATTCSGVASASGSRGQGGQRSRDRKWRMEGLHHGRRRRARRGGADHKTR
jgi:hypothetical protein